MKRIAGYDKSYYVDKLGNVYDCNKKKMQIYRFDNGYVYCKLKLNGIIVNRLVHILVAKAFIPNPKKKLLVNHKDLNKSNPIYSNLEWVTHSENQKHHLRLRGGKV